MHNGKSGQLGECIVYVVSVLVVLSMYRAVRCRGTSDTVVAVQGPAQPNCERAWKCASQKKYVLHLE